MKYLILSILFVIPACALRSTKTTSKIQFEELRQFKFGVSTEKDLISLFGPPATREQNQDSLTLTYNDTKGEQQRFLVNFDPKSLRLVSYVWIPREDEKAFKVSEAKKLFKAAVFKEVPEENPNPHFFSSERTMVDEKLGITILYDQDRQTVEAISNFDVSQRRPANSNEKRPIIPYTL